MDRLEHIFERQRSYLASLRSIYAKNQFYQHLEPYPWSLNSRIAQEEFRLLAWRFTEELVEATIEADPQKYITELADALHFLVELGICTGIGPTELYGNETATWDSIFADAAKAMYYGQRKGYGDLCALSITHLGEAMCCLKQRPWRTDYRPTDAATFRVRYRIAFLAFITDCVHRGVSADALYDAFFAKAAVNDQRIKDQP